MAIQTETDPELLEAFAQEVTEIKKELTPIANKMRVSFQDAKLFENFGQIIDRIYGTAATLGFPEFAAYCLSIKKINYKCSQSTNGYAMGQVKDIDLICMGLLDKFIGIIKNPNDVKKIQYTMKKESEKCDDLSRKIFGEISRKTTAA